MTFRTLLLSLTLATALPALAADTPSVEAPPSVADRLTKAREAIAAKNWRTALFELDEAARIEPRNADVHNLLGYSHRKSAPPNLPKAFEHYRMALQIDPRHRGAHEYIGEAWLMDNKPEEAEKHLAELEKICGRSCEEYRDLAQAIAAYKARRPSPAASRY